jgi:hypothetical protein
MNRRFHFRSGWISRLLILCGFAAAVSVAACGEKLEAGAACPLLCPQQDVQLKDTTIDAIAVDSTLPGFPIIGEEQPLLLAARGDTLDTRVIFRFDSISKSYPHPSAPADSLVNHVDSAMLRIVLDTATLSSVPGLPTAPVTVELYDVDGAASDTVAADLLPLFNSSRLIGTKTFAPESLTKDTLFLPVDQATVLGKIVNGQHLRIGLRLVASTSTQLRIFSSATSGAVLRFKPATDTAVTVSLLSQTPTDSTLAQLRGDLADYVITAKNLAVRTGNTIAVGGFPANRTYMRFDLPPRIVDSSTVVRATLYLTQSPMRNSPSATDSVGIYPFAITAGTILTDIPRLMRLVSVNTGLAADSLRVVPADSGARRMELVGIVRVWKNTKPEQTQRALVLVVGAEGSNPAMASFFSSEASADLRPRLQLTYVPRVTLGLP